MRELARKGTSIRSWVENPSSDPAERAVYEQYFDRYFFPTMRKSDPETLGDLGDMRANFFRIIESATPEIQQELTQKAFNFAKGVIGGRFVRPVKVNAVLLLGQLDEQYGQRGQQAKPLPAATMELCKYVYLSATKQNVPAYIHIAAMAGLERHASLFNQLDKKSKNALWTTLDAAINQKQFPPGVDSEVQDWMRMQAARAIASIRMPGPNGVFVDALQKLIGDKAVELGTRADVAGMLASLNLAPNSVPEDVAQRTAAAVRSLACEVAQSEKAHAVEFDDLHAQRRRFAMPFYESKRIRPAPDGWEYLRRGLIAQLEQLRAGLNAVASVAGDDAETLRSIAAALENTVEVAEEDNIDFDVTDSVKAMAGEVDEIAGCSAPAPGAEDEAASDLLGAAPAEGDGA